MTTRTPDGRYKLWQAARPHVRILVLSALPVLDLPSRYKVRRAGRRLAKKGLKRWPGMGASGTDAARLALLRLLYLQKATRRAVRTRQDEAATMLARVAIETYIVGLYCLYEPGAVARLQSGGLKMLRTMLEFLGGIVGEAGIPRSVLDERIQRLDSGTPAEGPKVWEMAEKVDAATNAKIAVSLYNRYYRPTSNLALHAGAASLLRHVHVDDSIAGRPSRVWGRRTPARIADACLGGLTAYLAHHEGQPWQHAARYADRHHERAVPPLTAISLGNLGRSLRVGQVGQIGPAIARIRALGQYVQSGQDADDPGIRTARIRSELEYLLNLPGLDIPRDSLGPFLDFLAEKIVAETQAPPGPGRETGPSR